MVKPFRFVFYLYTPNPMYSYIFKLELCYHLSIYRCRGQPTFLLRQRLVTAGLLTILVLDFQGADLRFRHGISISCHEFRSLFC